jgi:hypothetical protein
MSVNQTDTIDIIGTTPGGKVALTISDHHFWDEPLHLQLLQDKINAYLQFIESGQILDDYPDLPVSTEQRFAAMVAEEQVLNDSKSILL